jgi:nucleoside phosphorylase/CheY-like chemotaxis protein
MKPKKILWIEDDAYELEALLYPVRKDGHSIYIALDEKEALEQINKNNFDLIILDCILPTGKDIGHPSDDFEPFVGLRLAKTILKEKKIRTPVIVFSVIDDDKVINEFYNLGVQKYLSKTRILPSQFREEIYSVLESNIEFKARLQDVVNTLKSESANDLDKIKAYEELHLFASDNDSNIKENTAETLGLVFPYIVKDKGLAWEDLYHLAGDDNAKVRKKAAYSLDKILRYIEDKEQAIRDLIILSESSDKYVSAFANHSLGKASIFKATDANNEDDFKKELELALKFFEKSSSELKYENPAEFCYPFYRSFYILAFEKRQGSQEEIKRYIDEAKKVTKGSKAKVELLEAIENLSKALNEAYSLQETIRLNDFEIARCDLSAYSKYCIQVEDVLNDLEKDAPGATKVLRIGGKLIDKEIKKLIEDVKQKSEIICKTANFSNARIGCEIKKYTTIASATDNPVVIEKYINYIINRLLLWSNNLTDIYEKNFIECIINDAKDKPLDVKLLKIIIMLDSLERDARKQKDIDLGQKAVITTINMQEVDIMKANKSNEDEVDIGIIAIRADEFRSLLKEFIENGEYSYSKNLLVGESRHYNICVVQTALGNQYRVAIIRCGEDGNGESQDATRDLIEDVKPRLIIVAGIAGGVPNDDFTLGDVIVSTRINDFSVEEVTAGGSSNFDQRGGPIDRKLLGTVSNLPARESDMGPWNDSLYEHPPVDFDNHRNYTSNDEWSNKIRKSLEKHFSKKNRVPIFVTGTIASSDKLIKDPALLSQWLQNARKILAVEMESAGVYHASRDRVPALAIRGISDIVGFKRDDDWTKFACRSAAAFTHAFLYTEPIPPRNKVQPPANRKDVTMIGNEQRMSAYSKFMELMSKRPIDMHYAQYKIVPQLETIQLFSSPKVKGIAEEIHDWARTEMKNSGKIPHLPDFVDRINNELKPIIKKEIEDLQSGH